MKYLGTPNEWIPGVPNRDLSEVEWLALPEERRDYALASGLYVPEAE